MSDGSLGFPAAAGIPQVDGQLVSSKARPYVAYTLPANRLGMGWKDSGFTAEDQSFQLVELSPRDTEMAMKLGGKNQAKASNELIFAAISKVGSWTTRTKRKDLERWYTAIGGQGRKLVEAAFMALNSVEEGDVETFLASGQPGFGT